MRFILLGLCSVLFACAPAMPGSDAAVSDAAGDATQDGASDGAVVRDGGSDASGSRLCAPCVSSSDCDPGAFCVGGVAPRCGQSCADSACPGTLTCDTIHLGMGPILGSNCAPTTEFCGPRPDPGLTCTDTYQSFGRDFLSASCIGSCHRHDQSWPDLATIRASADNIRIDVERRLMPPPSDPQLSDAQIRRLLTWLACGAP